MKCIIPCAGQSSRMNLIPKSMLLVNGEPLIHQVVKSWTMMVDSFVFVVRRNASYFWELLPSNSAVVFQDEPKGLADAILRVEPYVQEPFIVVLGDCLVNGTFTSFPESPDMGIGVWKTLNREYYKSYSVQVQDSRVLRVQEKPQRAQGYCGMGVYFFNPLLFSFIRRTRVTPGGGDLTEVIQAMIDADVAVRPVYFKGKYINVGSPEDLKLAEEVLAR